MLEGGKQGNLGVRRWKQENIGVARRETRKYRCWKQGNIGIGKWETRKYMCWNVGNKGM